jgi:CheY-like chemotaxis protein
MARPPVVATAFHDRVDDAAPIRVLCIDGDPSSSEALAGALLRAGMIVAVAAGGAAGLTLATASHVDLLLVDLGLPDMSGLDVLTGLLKLGLDAPVVMIGAAVTVERAVDLVKAGAADVMQKPIAAQRLLDRATQLVEAARVRRRAALLIPAPGTRPRSAAEHWAHEVLKASRSEGDLKTLDDWATFAGLSYSSLCEMCRLVGVQPHDARDLVRVLGAVIRAGRHGCAVDVLLDVRDRRTLRSLLRRAGLETHEQAAAGTVSVDRFLDVQQFVPADNEGLRVLRRWLADANRAA